MSKRVSISDIARAANTSTATVSRVINDIGYPVSQELRERVLQVVESLHYSPSFSAQRLKQDFNHMIGLIARDISADFFGEIAKGATERAMELGYLSFICNTGRKPSNEMEFHELLWRNRVKGIVLMGGGFNTDAYRNMLQRQLERAMYFGFRIVATAPQGIDMPSVQVDNRAIADFITEYLVQRHHRTIALITGDTNVFTSMEHEEGFRQALTRHHLPIHNSLIQLHSFTEHAGYRCCKEMLRHNPRPSAICCGCDPIAIGVIHAAHEAQLKIPDDLSVISIGDTSLANYLNPPLTSMHVPRYEMGAKAVEMILASPHDQAEKIIMPATVIERDSVRELCT